MGVAFLIISIAAYNSIVIVMPKRLNRLELWTISLFALVLDWTIDGILDLKLDLYGYFNKGLDFWGLGVVFGIYPAVSMIYLNYYPYRQSVWAKAFYTAAWSGYTLLYEWASIQTGMFYHNGWRLWYSAVLNPVLFMVIVWHLSLLRKWERHFLSQFKRPAVYPLAQERD